MDDYSESGFGFHTRASALLNNKTFSDVEIQVRHGSSNKTFQAHKLFLAMSSKYFADKLYGPNTNSVKSLQIFDYQPKTVYAMLQYLYTDKLDLHNVEEARELYTLSKEFGIRNLQELCVDYISKGEFHTDSVLLMYECALRENFFKLLLNCRNFVSSNTKAVFEGPLFVEASVAVVKDIFQLETLAVDSELDVIHAAIKWAQRECKRQSLPDDSFHMRKYLLPLFNYIRFLCLKSDEFRWFVQQYKVLNEDESFMITTKLLQPNSRVSFPKGFCAISRQRKKPSMSSILLSHTSVSSQAPGVEIPRLEFSNTNLKSDSVSVLKRKTNSQSLNFYTTNKKIQAPISKVVPQVLNPRLKTFEFPLHEMQKSFNTAFNNDVKCAIHLQLLKGPFLIHGIELKIEQKPNIEEIISVFCKITSEKSSPKNDTYNEKLTDSLLKLMFIEPITVSVNNPVEIEVTIEDLKLNRCSIIKNRTCELVNELNIRSDIVVTSNQMNENGEYFFLINSFVYSAI